MNDSIKRRDFFRIAGLSGACSLAAANSYEAEGAVAVDTGISEGPLIRDVLKKLEAGKEKNTIPQIRAEIAENPKGVFIIETSVAAQKDEKGSYDSAGKQIEQAGYDLASSILQKGNRVGGTVSINPNWTYIPPNLRYPSIGITTAPWFVAGFAEGLRGIGAGNAVVTERSGGAKMLVESGHIGILDEHNILFIDANYKNFASYLKNELNWFDMPDGMVWKKVPAFRPHFDKDNFTINMPTMKCHNLGLTTLSIKNMQGFIPNGYGHYCDQWHQMYTIRPEMRKNIKSDYWEKVEKEFLKHRAQGWKYWDVENSYAAYQQKGGWKEFKKVRKDRKEADKFMTGVNNLMWDEQWGQRTIDTLAALKPDLNIVEGIIGRDGDAFANGTDYLTNYIVVGLDMVTVDAVTSYLMGHDPRELYYLKLAGERGYGPIDPENIPIFSIKNGKVEKIPDYRSLRRTKLGVYLHTRLKDGLVFY